MFIVAYVWRCRDMSMTHKIKYFNQMGLKVFHQNIRRLFDSITKLSTFLHTQKNTHAFSVSETHINNSTPKQLFKIPVYIFINKNKDFGTHGGVAVYIKDDIPFIRRTNLKIDELECVWLEINFPNTKVSLSVYGIDPRLHQNLYPKILTNFFANH